MTYQYEAALSFAGENRGCAEAVTTGLQAAGVSVFYDNFFESDLWGEDFSVKLRDIYYAQSRYCIMILSPHYVQKMWTIYERQQAIDRLISEKGGSYVLPVRLDGFNSEVDGLANTLGYLSVQSNEPQKVVETFLGKVGLQRPAATSEPEIPQGIEAHIPKLRKPFSDREKNQFIKNAFSEVVSFIAQLALVTNQKQPHFESELEQVTSRKVLFTFYSDDEELTRLKLWIGDGAFGFGVHSICMAHGSRLSVDSDNSMNESFSMTEDDGELKLKPLGFVMYGQNKDSMLSPSETAVYVWKAAVLRCGQIGLAIHQQFGH